MLCAIFTTFLASETGELLFSYPLKTPNYPLIRVCEAQHNVAIPDRVNLINVVDNAHFIKLDEEIFQHNHHVRRRLAFRRIFREALDVGEQNGRVLEYIDELRPARVGQLKVLLRQFLEGLIFTTKFLRVSGAIGSPAPRAASAASPGLSGCCTI